jgi:hypothetical protein
MKSQPVQRTLNTYPGPVQHMRVNHCGLHVFVSEELLHRSNVGTGFQQMGGERVAEGVRANVFR